MYLELILTGCLVASISHSVSLKKEINKAYINPNFGCYTRAASEVLGNKLIKRERRKIRSGELVMICVDVAGMGAANSRYGELAVNANMRSALAQVKGWRGVSLISQLNSGDEFILVVDKADAEGICKKLDTLFKSVDFAGAYTSTSVINKDFIESANEGMKAVYELKKAAKC